MVNRETYFEALGGRIRLTGWRATFAAIGSLGLIFGVATIVIKALANG